MDPIPATTKVVPPDINKSSGPQLIALLLHCGLLGVLSVQVYLYYLAFPQDRVHMKCLVYGIYCLELVQSVLIVETGFRIFVTNFQDVGVFDRIETLWLSVPVITAIDTFFVQVFYAHRISVLSNSKKVAGAIVSLSFIQLGGGIAFGVYAEEMKLYTSMITPKRLVVEGTNLLIWNGGSIVCDLIIAICMTYYLSRYDSNVKETKIILKKIIRLTIETGSLTAAIGILCFALAVSPISYYTCQTPMAIIGKVYANSMLALTNSRMILGSGEEDPLTILSELSFGAPPISLQDNMTEGYLS